MSFCSSYLAPVQRAGHFHSLFDVARTDTSSTLAYRGLRSSSRFSSSARSPCTCSRCVRAPFLPHSHSSDLRSDASPLSCVCTPGLGRLMWLALVCTALLHALSAGSSPVWLACLACLTFSPTLTSSGFTVFLAWRVCTGAANADLRQRARALAHGDFDAVRCWYAQLSSFWLVAVCMSLRRCCS